MKSDPRHVAKDVFTAPGTDSFPQIRLNENNQSGCVNHEALARNQKVYQSSYVDHNALTLE